MQRVRIALALLVVGAVGVAAPFAIAAISAGSSSSKVVTIKVTATEFKFVMSKRSVPKGTTVIFKVTNKGKIEHDFKIAGKKTKLLKPGAVGHLEGRLQEERKVRLPLHGQGPREPSG